MRDPILVGPYQLPRLIFGDSEIWSKKLSTAPGAEVPGDGAPTESSHQGEPAPTHSSCYGYLCTCIHICVYVNVCVYINTYGDTSIYIYIHRHEHRHRHDIYMLCTYAHKYTYTYTYMHIMTR